MEMDSTTKVQFFRAKSKDKGIINIVMETHSKDSGKMMKNTQVITRTRMEGCSKESSAKDKCLTVLWYTQMDKVIKDSFKMDKDMVLEYTETLPELFY